MRLEISAFSFTLFICHPVLASYDELNCASIGDMGENCTECFYGGSKRIGDTFRPFHVFNAGGSSRVIFKDENDVVVNFKTLNPETSWWVSNNLLRYPDSFVWFTSNSGRSYALVEAGQSVRILETQPERGIRLDKANDKYFYGSEYDFRLTFITSYRALLDHGNAGDLVEHNSCIFYRAKN